MSSAFGCFHLLYFAVGLAEQNPLHFVRGCHCSCLVCQLLVLGGPRGYCWPSTQCKWRHDHGACGQLCTGAGSGAADTSAPGVYALPGPCLLGLRVLGLQFCAGAYSHCCVVAISRLTLWLWMETTTTCRGGTRFGLLPCALWKPSHRVIAVPHLPQTTVIWQHALCCLYAGAAVVCVPLHDLLAGIWGWLRHLALRLGRAESQTCGCPDHRAFHGVHILLHMVSKLVSGTCAV